MVEQKTRVSKKIVTLLVVSAVIAMDVSAYCRL